MIIKKFRIVIKIFNSSSGKHLFLAANSRLCLLSCFIQLNSEGILFINWTSKFIKLRSIPVSKSIRLFAKVGPSLISDVLYSCSLTRIRYPMSFTRSYAVSILILKRIWTVKFEQKKKPQTSTLPDSWDSINVSIFINFFLNLFVTAETKTQNKWTNSIHIIKFINQFRIQLYQRCGGHILWYDQNDRYIVRSVGTRWLCSLVEWRSFDWQ